MTVTKSAKHSPEMGIVPLFPNRPPRRHSLDVASRVDKARKIERLLGIGDRSALDVLEIGTGSGAIAQYLGQRHTVDAVDVVDSRLVFDGFRFQVVKDASLPYPDESFDVVISNQVIEHVGPRPQQAVHLSEMRRVLKPSGLAYLGAPNRWRLIEPHYKLPFLSVLPERLRTPYLRAVRGYEYDAYPFEAWTLERMLRAAGFRFERLGGEAVRATLAIERGRALPLPAGTMTRLQPVMPTLIYRLHRA